MCYADFPAGYCGQKSSVSLLCNWDLSKKAQAWQKIRKEEIRGWKIDDDHLHSVPAQTTALLDYVLHL